MDFDDHYVIIDEHVGSSIIYFDFISTENGINLTFKGETYRSWHFCNLFRTNYIQR